jgi:hypothetical protein
MKTVEESIYSPWELATYDLEVNSGVDYIIYLEDTYFDTMNNARALWEDLANKLVWVRNV